MKLGLSVGYSERDMQLPMDVVKEADRLGYDSCWTAEAWGSDAFTPLAWIGSQTSNIKLGTAIAQVPARTPAMCAMTAMTLDALSGGRFVLGVGPSGPQVIEGWHGVPYQPSLTRTKEYVRIVRAILRREEKLTFDGECYQLPYKGPAATGLGKPLRSIMHGRADMKIYTAAITPLGIRAAAEVADGFFPIFTDPERFDLFEPHIETGLAKRDDLRREDFDVLPSVGVSVGDDLSACLNAFKPGLALYIGGMGAREKNFYNELACKMGYRAEAKQIQDLFLAGKREEAAAKVPDALVDAVNLCGSRERIADRLVRWQESATSTLCINTSSVDVVRMMAELVL